MKTYTIYYGTKPDGTDKIGCCSNYPYRVNVQNLTNYYVMETHSDIDIASDREIELQIQHFGKRDNNTTYKQSVELLEKYRTPFTSETAREASLKVNPENRVVFTAELNLELARRPKLKARALNPEQVKEIRDVYVPFKYPFKKDLALQYNVSESSINKATNYYSPYDYETP